jgi:subtilisin family serine protease
MYHFPSSAGQGVDIYVMDTGIDITHEEFGGRAKWGGTFVTEVGTPNDDDAGHGTMVASVIGGNNLGVAKKANLIAVKILNSKGEGTTSSTIRALSWVWNRYTTNTSPKGMTIVK